jgi:transcriptional regulator with XRE-family HTH domain
VRRLRGVNAVAKRIGYSHTHIIRVMRGERTASRELAAKLRKLGVEVPEVPAAQ